MNNEPKNIEELLEALIAPSPNAAIKKEPEIVERSRPVPEQLDDLPELRKAYKIIDSSTDKPLSIDQYAKIENLKMQAQYKNASERAVSSLEEKVSVRKKYDIKLINWYVTSLPDPSSASAGQIKKIVKKVDIYADLVLKLGQYDYFSFLRDTKYRYEHCLDSALDKQKENRIKLLKNLGIAAGVVGIVGGGYAVINYAMDYIIAAGMGVVGGGVGLPLIAGIGTHLDNKTMSIDGLIGIGIPGAVGGLIGGPIGYQISMQTHDNPHLFDLTIGSGVGGVVGGLAAFILFSVICSAANSK